MTGIFAPRPSDRPPHREDWTAGATMSVIAHAALVAALVWGVHWHSESDEGVTAELWSQVPQFAAPAPTSPPPQPEPPQPTPAPKPAPVPPPPPPVAAPKPPDIVTEQQVEKLRKQQEQQQKAEADKAEKLKQQQQQKLDAQKLAKLHDDYLKRALGQLDAPPNSTGVSAHNSGPTSTWAGKVAALIRSHIIWGEPLDGLQSPEVSVRLGVDGTILSFNITKSSGNPRFDQALLRAIEATQTLPRDVDGRVPSGGVIVYNPKG